jgi:hypothetical protein
MASPLECVYCTPREERGKYRKEERVRRSRKRKGKE